MAARTSRARRPAARPQPVADGRAVRTALIDGHPLPVAGKTVTGRRLNIDKAIRGTLRWVRRCRRRRPERPRASPPPARCSTAPSTRAARRRRGCSSTARRRPTARRQRQPARAPAAPSRRSSAPVGGLRRNDLPLPAGRGPRQRALPRCRRHFQDGLAARRAAAHRAAGGAAADHRSGDIAGPARQGARIACSRKRGKYRCRVSLTRESGLKVKLVVKRGTKVVARGSGTVGKRITLKGSKAEAGRYKVKLTFTEGTKKVAIIKRIRVR